jgi:hypothetical protein
MHVYIYMNKGDGKGKMPDTTIGEEDWDEIIEEMLVLESYKVKDVPGRDGKSTFKLFEAKFFTPPPSVIVQLSVVGKQADKAHLYFE